MTALVEVTVMAAVVNRSSYVRTQSDWQRWRHQRGGWGAVTVTRVRLCVHRTTTRDDADAVSILTANTTTKILSGWVQTRPEERSVKRFICRFS